MAVKQMREVRNVAKAVVIPRGEVRVTRAPMMPSQVTPSQVMAMNYAMRSDIERLSRENAMLRRALAALMGKGACRGR